MKRLHIILVLTGVLMLLPRIACAQYGEIHDTLDAAVKTDTRRIAVSLGEISANLDGVRNVVSPLGEGDPIRWAQSLPRVVTGADGSSSFFVRGGNMGNNLITLDGVPVYGYSHILGLTTIIPQDVMSSVSILKGGFEGGEGNFTAGHLRITTRDPRDDRFRMSAALNNFLASVGVETPIGKKVSFMMSGRISPRALEYRALRGILPEFLGGFDDFGAGVGDVYAKLHVETSRRSRLDASFIGSMDHYSFTAQGNAHEVMGWDNMVGTLKYHLDGRKAYTDITASVNRYSSMQQQSKEYRGEMNVLSLKSELLEYMLSFDRVRSTSQMLKVDYGAKLRYAGFAPGQVASVDNSSQTILGTGYVQARFDLKDIFSMRAAVRGHYFHNLKDDGSYADVDASASLKWNILRYLSVEASFDRMVQYYHTLEGLPIGWSLDMIVPSGNKILPELSMQGNLGLSSQIGKHSMSVGGFYKKMDNLVYYRYAQTLFNGGMAGWEEHTDMGQGISYGAELMHEYVGRDLYTRVAYTLSKTNRFGFQSVNDGGEFNARFDRRHVLNVSAQWKGISASMTLQSGHWENGAPETYPMHVPGAEWVADYYSVINNYKMPTVFRLDLGYAFSFETKKVKHDVNVGVCNVTNHFNPFMLYFDASSENWKMIALLPIFPNFSYRISF